MRLRFASMILMSSVVAACGSSTPSSPTPSGMSVSIVAGASTLTTTAYAPNPIVVPVGGTVSWMNNDTTTHTSTANGGTFSSGSIAPGATFSTTFAAAGSFPYHCTIHPGMVGTVTVQ
jgi:plastocyanin